jgi:hypothetical protein
MVAPRTTRVTALAAGTFGLLVIAALVLVVTPKNPGAPIAVEASTTLVDSSSANSPAGNSAGNSADMGSAALGIGGLSTLSTGELSTTTIVADVLAALATPVGDGSYAIVTMKSLAGQRDGMVVFRLLSGDIVIGEIMFEFDDAVLVSIPTTQTPHAIATDKPHRSDMVTVMSETPVDMAFAEVAQADVPEGTPVVDDEGALVGLCSKRDDGTTEVIEVDQVPVDPADLPPASPPDGSIGDGVAESIGDGVAESTGDGVAESTGDGVAESTGDGVATSDDPTTQP